MINEHWRAISRIGLVLLVLLSGISLLPFTGLSAQKLGWELYAGIYQPDLNVVGEDKGFPGSAFLFQGDGYPPNTLATVYRDGVALGTLMTDGQGQAQFLIQSEPGDSLGRYYMTMATDANTSATDDIRLEDDEPLIPPPPGWDGPTFLLFGDPLTPTPTATATETGTPVTPTQTPTATSTVSTPTPTATGTVSTPTPTATGTVSTPTPTATGIPPEFDVQIFLPVMERSD